VTTMRGMLSGAGAFNQPIGGWNTGRVTDMSTMFNAACAFNQPIGEWDVRRVTDMSSMFSGAHAFNQPIGKWDVGNVTDMSRMFEKNPVFDQTLSGWNTGSVTDMDYMFAHALEYNNGGQPLEFDTARVRRMSWMFAYSFKFAQRAKFSDMGAVQDVYSMFHKCNPAGVCVTNRVNQDADGLEKQKNRILQAPNTGPSATRS
jgi:surface protein